MSAPTVDTLASIHEELTVIARRKAVTLDLLIRSLIELDTLSLRADVLMDRRLLLGAD